MADGRKRNYTVKGMSALNVDVHVMDTATPFLLELAETMPKEFARALKSVGWWLSQDIKKGIEAEAPAGQKYVPLTPRILNKRQKAKVDRSSGKLIVVGRLSENRRKPLGRLKQAVGYQFRQDQITTRIGWLSGSAARLGEAQEGGANQPFTPKMRRFFWANAVPVGKSTSRMYIPARPTIGPVFEQRQSQIPGYIEDKIWKDINNIKA